MTLEEENIEKAIRRVQSGELSPAEATKLLLDKMRHVERQDMRSPIHTETLSQLVTRLGSPPVDVLNRWSDDVLRVTIAIQAAGQALPSTDPDHWFLTGSGDLVLADLDVPNIDVGSVSPDVRESARQHAAVFRQQFAAQAATEISTPEISTPELPQSESSMRPTPVADEVVDEPPPESSPLRRVSTGWRRTALIRGLFVVAVGAIGAVLWMASQKPAAPLAEQVGPRPVEEGITHRLGTGSPTTDPIAQNLTADQSDILPIQPETIQLETFQSDPSGESLSAAVSEEWLSLDAMMPMLSSGSDSSVASSSTESGSNDANPSPLKNGDKEIDSSLPKSDAAMLSVGGGDDPLAESDDMDGPDESPQLIHQASETAVALPPVDDSDSMVWLAPVAFATPSLEFPIEVNVELRRAEADANSPAEGKPAEGNPEQGNPVKWIFVDRKNEQSLANILVAEEQSEFQWTSSAKRSSVANLISHGSLRDSNGRLVFLRPKVVADPYAISFDASDSRPSWDLLATLPPRVARVSVGFDLPKPTKQSDGIELGWIEPIDSTSPRRTRGLAVLKPTDGETIEVGIRLDLRCSRTLSARVRVFGRLDSTMSWQLISTSILQNAANQITNRATRLSQISSEMSVVYSRAGSSQRSNLRPQRDAIEQEGKRIAEASKRIAELQSLIKRIETEVRVRFRLWVQWPESQQDVLVMDDAKEE